MKIFRGPNGAITFDTDNIEEVRLLEEHERNCRSEGYSRAFDQVRSMIREKMNAKATEPREHQEG